MAAKDVTGESTENTMVPEDETARFRDEVVIVTGASKGIGLGIAKLYLKRNSKLIITARDEENLRRVEDSLGCFAIKADVSIEADMQRVVDLTLQRYGKIDILVHNAGVYPTARLEDMTLPQWQEVIDINLTGTFLAVKACIPIMKAQRRGRIVIISSISGPQTALPGYAHYTASKGGVAGFVKTAAVELAKYRINVNAVEPGNIITEGYDELDSEHARAMLAAIPMGRLGLPEDVAHAALFLASEEASYITGQSIIGM